MANPQHLRFLRQGVKKWNTWRLEKPHIEPDLAGADVSGMKLDHFLFGETNFQGATFTETSLRHTTFTRANLTHTTLKECEMDQANFTAAQFEGADCSGIDFRTTFLTWTNFTQAQLPDTHFGQLDLMRTSFVKANLRGAIFDEANLYLADLSEANLTEASFQKACLNQTQLTGANFTGAFLQEAFFQRAIVRSADLTHASIWETTFNDMDLSEVWGLEQVVHQARSSIDLHTWWRSQGNIPAAFLRGTGLPEHLFRALNDWKIQHESVVTGFIMHHPTDEIFASQLFHDLQQAGVRCWLTTGQEMRRSIAGMPNSINKVIQAQDKLFLIVSEKEWPFTKYDIQDILKREQQSSTQLLYPLYIDQLAWDQSLNLPQHSLPKERWVGNFVGWQQEQHYQMALQKLLKELQQ